MKYKIEYVKNKVKGGWIGMNAFAAKEHNLPYKHKHPEHTLVVYNQVPHAVIKNTIVHEKVEEYLMKNKKMHYHPAHDLALRYENLNKPFSVKEVQRMLSRRKK